MKRFVKVRSINCCILTYNSSIARLTIEHASIDVSFRRERESCRKTGTRETAAVDLVLTNLDYSSHNQSTTEYSCFPLRVFYNHSERYGTFTFTRLELTDLFCKNAL